MVTGSGIDPVLAQAARMSLCFGMLGATLSLLIGGAAGLGLGRAAPAGFLRRIWESVLAWPFLLSSTLAGVLAIRWLEPLGLSYGAQSVGLVMVAMNAPWVAVRVAQARAAIPDALYEQAAVLGAGGGGRLRWVTWPALRSALRVAWIEVYLSCTSSLALVQILGGGPPVETLEVLLLGRLQSGDWQWERLAPVAWASLGVALPVLLLGLRFSAPLVLPPAVTRGPRVSMGAKVGVLLLCALAVAPWGGALLQTPWEWGGGEERRSFVSSLLLTLGVAGLGGALLCGLAFGVLLGVPYRWLSVGNTLSVLLSSFPPLGLAALGVLGFSALGVDAFEYSAWGFVLGVALTHTPFLFRWLLPLRSADARLERECARILGAGAWRARWLSDGPRWRPYLASGWGIGTAILLGESAWAWVFPVHDQIPFLTQLMQRWAAAYRLELAQTAAAVLLFLSVAVYALAVNALRGRAQ